jgi:plasmid stability protein
MRLGGCLMPALLMDNIPPEIYELLQRRADARRRSVQDEAIDLLQRSLRREGFAAAPRLPDLIIAEEISPPWDLPRPGPSESARTHPGKPRLPDLLT